MAVLQSDPLMPHVPTMPLHQPPLSSSLSSSRSLSNSPPPPPRLAKAESNPTSTSPQTSNSSIFPDHDPHPPLSLLHESTTLKSSLTAALASRASPLSLHYTCKPCTPSTFLSTLTSNPTLAILHYSGHGTRDHLTLENDDASTVPLTAPNISSLLDMAPKTLKLVFLSACRSESVSPPFITAGIPHVVCISSSTNVLDSGTGQIEG